MNSRLHTAIALYNTNSGFAMRPVKIAKEAGSGVSVVQRVLAGS